MSLYDYGDDFEITYIGVLHARTRRALIRAGITTLGQLRESAEAHCWEGDIKGIGNVGWFDIYQLLGLEWPWRAPKQRES